MQARDERIEQIIVLVVLGLLVVASFVVLRPFLTSLIWALILSISTWPTFLWIERRLGGRRGPAAMVMTLLLVLGLFVPLTIIGGNLADNVTVLAEKVRAMLQAGPPAPPSWLSELPFVGDDLLEKWLELTRQPEKLATIATSYIGPVSRWLLNVAAILGSGLVELSLSILMTFFFYRDGVAGGKRLAAVVGRLAGERAHRLLDVARTTMEGVIYGILGTALAQGTLLGIGLWLAGVPGAFLLGVITAFVSVTPIGPPLIWMPAAAWLYFSQGQLGWALFTALWGALAVGTIDNVVKPLFISRGSALPLLLVFLGVLGGGLAFGFLGIFIGPTLLAVAYTLMKEWSGEGGLALAGSSANNKPDTSAADATDDASPTR